MPLGVPEIPTTGVLIVVAGSTGLMFACRLTRCRVRVRIIDSKAGPTQETSATVVQAHTPEFCDQPGLSGQAHQAGRC